MEDIGRLSIAQENLRKSTDLLRRIIAPVDAMGGVVVRLPALHMVGIDGKLRRQQQKEEALQLVVCSMLRPIRMDSTIRILVVQIGANADTAKVFKAHAALLGLCDNLINEPKLLANHQKDGDSPIQSIITGLRERSGRGIWMD